MLKPRIIYFQQNLALGATEDYFSLLMQGLDKTRFEVIFICPRDTVLDPLAARLEALKLKVYRYNLDIGHFRLILHLRSLFRKLTPDIAHFNDPCLSGIIAARLAGVPVLLMTHHTPELNRRYNFRGRMMEAIALRYCRPYAIFTSEYSRDTGLKKDKIAQERSFVIYYGLPPERFSATYDKKEVYAEFSIDPHFRLIANVARLDRIKGQRYLIEAASIVRKKIPSVKFFFVGSGPIEPELKAQVREKGLQDYFIFTGYRNDIPRLLSAFEMLVMPSWFEGLCFAVIEASAMGIPVIATAVGGVQRSVINGKTGILVPPHDPQALADAMIWMLEHPREAQEMGLAGKKYFAETFTLERMLKQTTELYHTLLQ